MGNRYGPPKTSDFYEGGFTAMVDDIKAVMERMRMEHPDLPLILLGHSMGSMAVRSFAKRYDNLLSGLIVCGSPSRNSGAPVGRLIARLYALIAGKKCRPRLIQRLAFGSFNRRFRHEGSPNAWVCSDPEIVLNYDDQDPLCNFQFTADGFINLFSLMQDAYSTSGWHPSRPDMPVLFISGEDDPCLLDRRRFDEAVRTMRRAGYTDVQSRLYTSMRHEILNETGKETVWHDILTFCSQIADHARHTYPMQ